MLAMLRLSALALQQFELTESEYKAMITRINEKSDHVAKKANIFQRLQCVGMTLLCPLLPLYVICCTMCYDSNRGTFYNVAYYEKVRM